MLTLIIPKREVIERSNDLHLMYKTRSISFNLSKWKLYDGITPTQTKILSNIISTRL